MDICTQSKKKVLWSDELKFKVFDSHRRWQGSVMVCVCFGNNREFNKNLADSKQRGVQPDPQNIMLCHLGLDLLDEDLFSKKIMIINIHPNYVEDFWWKGKNAEYSTIFSGQATTVGGPQSQELLWDKLDRMAQKKISNVIAKICMRWNRLMLRKPPPLWAIRPSECDACAKWLLLI